MSQSVFYHFPAYRHKTVIYHVTTEFKFIALQHLLFYLSTEFLFIHSKDHPGTIQFVAVVRF